LTFAGLKAQRFWWTWRSPPIVDPAEGSAPVPKSRRLIFVHKNLFPLFTGGWHAGVFGKQNAVNDWGEDQPERRSPAEAQPRVGRYKI
jgi:hypothetical protein